jgi:protein-tyrosine phosphatase
MISKERKSILFVCMANICRSPVLEATLRHFAANRGLGDKLQVDSCGIGWFHIGEHPDPRAFEAAKKRGILVDHRAQQFQDEFFDQFDLILTVDPDLSEQLKLRAKSPKQIQKIHLATEFSSKYKGKPIPDPYYMSPNGFEEMMDMIVDCCEGVLDRWVSKH